VNPRKGVGASFRRLLAGLATTFAALTVLAAPVGAVKVIPAKGLQGTAHFRFNGVVNGADEFCISSTRTITNGPLKGGTLQQHFCTAANQITDPGNVTLSLPGGTVYNGVTTSNVINSCSAPELESCGTTVGDVVTTNGTIKLLQRDGPKFGRATKGEIQTNVTSTFTDPFTFSVLDFDADANQTGTMTAQLHK